MEQPIILDQVISFDGNPTLFVTDKTVTREEFPEALNAPVGSEFELQEKWITAIAHCPFLSPDHQWKVGNIQICIDFIPAEPYIDDEWA
ncbi:hypothetical protein [Leptothoe sp. PORK10 BA2]|uniref:hypothetical protein n=1 Tax=Leptothoe sp. PORK10 BA2 TaxID=3110254 RepID=UPI002B20E16B|nr:hypothetical protein [Leptothoe sp. PORK10 BA2]MEA5463688.1 hypothetical protein [Leptothoe sp. PORK10 BA2]